MDSFSVHLSNFVAQTKFPWQEIHSQYYLICNGPQWIQGLNRRSVISCLSHQTVFNHFSSEGPRLWFESVVCFSSDYHWSQIEMAVYVLQVSSVLARSKLLPMKRLSSISGETQHVVLQSQVSMRLWWRRWATWGWVTLCKLLKYILQANYILLSHKN